jgi:hypothetical protein
MKKELVSAIFVSTFTSVLIGIFYFWNVSVAENEIITKQANNVAIDMCESTSLFIPSSYSLNISSQDVSDADIKIKDNNDALKKKALYALLIFSIVGSISGIILSKIWKLKLGPIILTSFILLAFVFLTEYLFLKIIMSNYTYIDPNFVKKTILSSLVQNSTTPIQSSTVSSFFDDLTN